MTQSFTAHVQELRRRLSWSVLVLCLGAAIGYLFRDKVLDWLQAPLHSTLYYSQITGAFEFIMQACLLVGLVAAIPVLVYNVVSFLRPALPKPVSRKMVTGIVLASCSLTVGGVAFGYYISLPTVLHFLSTIDVSHLHPLIAANSYLSFVIGYLAVFAAIFQLPLIVLFIDRITPIPPQMLRRLRKWVIIGAFGAALILPIAPDPVSQVMLALPVVLLYEASLWLVVMSHHLRARTIPSKASPLPLAGVSAMTAANIRTPKPPTIIDPLRAPRHKVIDLSQL